jgi:hypothetical protein
MLVSKTQFASGGSRIDPLLERVYGLRPTSREVVGHDHGLGLVVSDVDGFRDMGGEAAQGRRHIPSFPRS